MPAENEGGNAPREYASGPMGPAGAPDGFVALAKMLNIAFKKIERF